MKKSANNTVAKWQIFLGIIAALGIVLEFINQFVIIGNVFSVEISIIALTVFALITGISNLK